MEGEVEGWADGLARGTSAWLAHTRASLAFAGPELRLEWVGRFPQGAAGAPRRPVAAIHSGSAAATIHSGSAAAPWASEGKRGSQAGHACGGRGGTMPCRWLRCLTMFWREPKAEGDRVGCHHRTGACRCARVHVITRVIEAAPERLGGASPLTHFMRYVLHALTSHGGGAPRGRHLNFTARQTCLVECRL